jgi:hypothetical protein
MGKFEVTFKDGSSITIEAEHWRTSSGWLNFTNKVEVEVEENEDDPRGNGGVRKVTKTKIVDNSVHVVNLADVRDYRPIPETA